MTIIIPDSDLAVFFEKCDALIASKLILSDKKIADILKSIAASQPFCRVVEQCLQGFNYKLEFLKAKTPDPVKPGKSVLKLPEGRGAVAFAFCLLVEIDNRDMDFTSFLQEFFGLDELFTDGFANFCAGVIVPFKQAVAHLAGTAADNPVSAEADSASKPPESLVPLNITEKDYAALVGASSELVRNISREPDLTARQRSEYAFIVSMLVRAAKDRDADYLKAMYFSLKNLCAQHKYLNLKLKSIEKIIKDIQKIN